MGKKCFFCKNEITDGRVIDVCQKCGVGIWGEKMFNTIDNNMRTAKEKGDLELNSADISPKKSEHFFK